MNVHGVNSQDKNHMTTKRARVRPYKHIELIEAFLWDVRMGVVALDPAYGYYAFSYAPEFLATGVEPAPLTMPASSSDPYIFNSLHCSVTPCPMILVMP